MKKYFVTFSNSKFLTGRDRIINKAKKLEYFDKCFSYGPEILSEGLKKSGLLNFERGYGYWSWKPDVILKAFEEMKNDDLLVYVDSGCYLYKDNEWKKLFKRLQNKDILLFNIPNKVICWTKKSVLEFFNITEQKQIKNKYLVAGGILFFKKNKKTINFVNEWRDLMIKHPHLLYDVKSDEFKEQNDMFIEHRHDQALLTQLATKKDKVEIDFMWENFESKSWYGQAIFAARSNELKQRKVKTNIFKYSIRHFIIYPILTFYKTIKN